MRDLDDVDRVVVLIRALVAEAEQDMAQRRPPTMIERLAWYREKAKEIIADVKRHSPAEDGTKRIESLARAIVDGLPDWGMVDELSLYLLQGTGWIRELGGEIGQIADDQTK